MAIDFKNTEKNISTHKGFDYYVVLFTAKTIIPLCKGDVLEMGPADGLMTKMLAEKFKVTAVDGSEYLLDKAKEYVDNQDVEFVHCLFEEYEPGKKFDTIILSHVLEHVDNPVDVLARAKSWIKDKGNFIICVPNAQSLHRKIGVKMKMLKTEYELNDKDISIGHKRVYDMNLLEKDIIAAGLKTKTKGGIFLKPMSNAQMLELNEDYFNALFEVGKNYPEIAAEIYIEAAI